MVEEAETPEWNRCDKCLQQVRYVGAKRRHRGMADVWQHFDGKKWTSNCPKGGKHYVRKH